jgi:hypothetical protein
VLSPTPWLEKILETGSNAVRLSCEGKWTGFFFFFKVGHFDRRDV